MEKPQKNHWREIRLYIIISSGNILGLFRFFLKDALILSHVKYMKYFVNKILEKYPEILCKIRHYRLIKYHFQFFLNFFTNVYK